MIANPDRRGTALVMTFVILGGVAAIVTLLSEKQFGASRLEAIDLAKQRAMTAAESAAAMVEAKLVGRSAELTNLTCSLTDATAQPTFWNLKGFANGTQSATTYNHGALWIGGCLVRWRLEPVKIFDSTLTTATAPTGNYALNYEADPNNPTPSGVTNDAYYHFRICTEAYALKNPSLTSATPWNDPSQRVCVSQAQRIVQMQVVNLFKYALFHAAEGPTGDIDFESGGQLKVAGAVHSNGAIYFGGGGSTNYLTGDYATSCSGGSGQKIGGSAAFSPATAQNVTIVGVNGLFRTSKMAMYGMWIDNPTINGASARTLLGTPINPYNIPQRAWSGWATLSNSNLNGETDTSSTHQINDANFVSSNDARTYATMRTAFSNRARDRNLGATVVKTLANIKEMAGRPFEPQRIAAEGERLYCTDPTSITTTLTRFTTSYPLYYTDYAAANYTPTTTALTGSGAPRAIIYASEMPLFDRAGNGVYDVWPSTTTAIALDDSQSDPKMNTYLPLNIAMGWYLNLALNGYPNEAVRGIAIRERGQQNTNWTWKLNLADIVATQAPPGSKPLAANLAAAPYSGDVGRFNRAYAAWMKSNYAVYLGTTDITNAFFDYGLGAVAAASVDTTVTASEDSFRDKRQIFYWYNPKFTSNGSGVTPWDDSVASVTTGGYITKAERDTARISTLTVNWAAVQSFLTSTSRAALGISGAGSASTLFNGVIYVHRTPRYTAAQTYHPITRPFPTSALPGTGTLRGLMRTIPEQSGTALQVGTVPVVIPNCKAVRFTGLTTVNYGEVVQATATTTRPRGLALVTPQHAYMWKDISTTATYTAGAVSYPTPVAIYSDGITALSNSFTDSANDVTFSAGLSAASSTTYNTSLVTNNVPYNIDNLKIGEGSSQVANCIRYIENWGGTTMTFSGSMVIQNQQRYSRAPLCASRPITGYGAPGTRNIKFNTDLLSAPGQPPYSPFGIQVTRVVSTVNLIDN